MNSDSATVNSVYDNNNDDNNADDSDDHYRVDFTRLGWQRPASINRSGPNLIQVWSEPGPDLVPTWSRARPNLVQIRSQSGPDMAPI